MARTDNTDWIEEGSLRMRFRQEGRHLVRELNQPDRNVIMAAIQEDKKREQRRFLGGYLVGSIPLVDWERVKLRYPDLEKGDADQKKRALIRFSNDPEMQQYLIKKA